MNAAVYAVSGEGSPVYLRPATEAEYIAWLSAWFRGQRTLLVDGRRCVVVEGDAS